MNDYVQVMNKSTCFYGAATCNSGVSSLPKMERNGNLAETVALLDRVSERGAIDQRTLARQIGISVGLLNALIHRAARKGLIKIKEAPARRYAYYLTPRGFAEKSRLVGEYLDYSLSFFRVARQEYSDIFARCAAAGQRDVILCGAGELAEIALLAVSSLDVRLVAIFDQRVNHARMYGLPVLRDPSAIDAGAVLVMTEGRKSQEVYDQVADVVGAHRIIAPAFLRILIELAAPDEAKP